MKKYISILISCLILIPLIITWRPKPSLQSHVKSSMQERLNTHEVFSKYNLKVKDVTLIKRQGNEYKGVASVLYKGKSYQVGIDVTADGQNVIMQTELGGMMFLLGDAYKDLMNMSQ